MRSKTSRSSAHRLSSVVVVFGSLATGCVIDEVHTSHPVIVEQPVVVSDRPPVASPLVIEPTEIVVLEPVSAPSCAPVEPVACITTREEPVSVAQFETALSPYGEWIAVADYGRVWRPTCVAVDYRPYTCGRWVLTDCGWAFVPDRPWGVIVYHYGRWSCVPRHGWVWVPDTVWAPAWVSWRECDDYIGWAPLPPGSHYSVSATVGFSSFEERIHPSCWTFVPSHRFLASNCGSVAVDARQNVTIINKTKNVTKIQVSGTVAKNGGPETRLVERATGSRVKVNPASANKENEQGFLGRSSHRAPVVGATGFAKADRTERDESKSSSGRRVEMKSAAPASRVVDLQKDADRGGFARLGKQEKDSSPVTRAPSSSRSEAAVAQADDVRDRAAGRPSSSTKERKEARRPEASDSTSSSGGFRALGSKRVSATSIERTATPTSIPTRAAERKEVARLEKSPSSNDGKSTRSNVGRTKIVASPPQVEGRLLGSDSAATSRPEPPAARGAVIRGAKLGSIGNASREKSEDGPSKDSAKAEHKKTKP